MLEVKVEFKEGRPFHSAEVKRIFLGRSFLRIVMMNHEKHFFPVREILTIETTREMRMGIEPFKPWPKPGGLNQVS